MTFVDTSAWFAAYVPTDSKHRQVRESLAASSRLVTTDFVLDESVTLLKARGHLTRARKLGPRILEGQVAEFVHVTPQDIEQAWIVFSTWNDNAWSFTDCTSLVVMKRLGITQAIALDEHFRQMPGIVVIGYQDR